MGCFFVLAEYEKKKKNQQQQQNPFFSLVVCISNVHNFVENIFVDIVLACLHRTVVSSLKDDKGSGRFFSLTFY